MMNNRLEPIILQKQLEVAALRALIANQPNHPITQLLQGKTQRTPVSSFKNALRGSSLAVIAEIKRKSPSKGMLAAIDDPVCLAQTYLAGEASALSILTDTVFVGGYLHDLSNVNHALGSQRPPILRKDFVIDEIQIAEAILAGADAILCIVAVLGEHTKTMLDAARRMGIDVLVEVHNSSELEIALLSGAEIIGVNNRDLTTFEIDTHQALRLVDDIPSHLIRVAESGIFVPELAHDYYRAGFDAVLIGEALVKSPNPGEFIRACRHG